MKISDIDQLSDIHSPYLTAIMLKCGRVVLEENTLTICMDSRQPLLHAFYEIDDDLKIFYYPADWMYDLAMDAYIVGQPKSLESALKLVLNHIEKTAIL